MRGYCFLLIFLFCSLASRAQLTDTSIFAFPIQLDEVAVKATQEGFDIADFIRRVRTDTTFYKAFRTLHLVPYTSTNDIKILDKKGGVQASLYSRTKQNITGRCRSMQVLEERTTGDFYDRKKEYNYFTAELYASIFFTKGQVCGENNNVAGAINERGSGQLDKAKWQLKQLIFNPGSKVGGVPFAGNKAAIFEPGEAKKYNFRLLSVEYTGEDCWLFSALPKKEYKNDVLYNELSTWFRKSDYAIVARDYALSYKTLVYDFDVKMKVRLKNVNGQLLPSTISYSGNWDVPTKPRERAQFTTSISY